MKFHLPDFNNICSFSKTKNKYSYSESFVRDRDRDRERDFFFGLTFHHDHFGICQEYSWGQYAHGTLTITCQERNFHCMY